MPPSLRPLIRRDAPAWFLYVVVAVALGFVDYRVRRYPEHVLTDYIPSVISGSASAPGLYRVLAPYAIKGFLEATALPAMIGYLITRLVVLYAALVTLHVYLRSWYARAAAIGGTLAAAALLPLTFTNSWMHPDSFFELALFTLGCAAVARRWDTAFYPILAVAALNRETSVFLVLLWGSYRLRESLAPATIARWGSYGLTWAVIYVGLRWMRGLHHYQYWMLQDNLKVLVPLPVGFDPYTRVVGELWLVLLIVPAAFAILGVLTPTGSSSILCRHAAGSRTVLRDVLLVFGCRRDADLHPAVSAAAAVGYVLPYRRPESSHAAAD